MKKVFALVLVAALILGMAAHTFAEEELYTDLDRLLPIAAKDSVSMVIFYHMEDIGNLSEEAQKLMEEAYEKLDEANPNELALRYFCMVELLGSGDEATIDFEPIEHDVIEFKQYINGEWVELEHKVNQDGTISVSGIVNAPLTIFTKYVDKVDVNDPSGEEKRDSISASMDFLLPDITKQSSMTVLLHSAEMVPHLSEEIQEQMAAAKEKIQEACPEGFAAKFFCYVEIIGEGKSASVVFEKIEYNEIHFEQFVDGEWVELPFEVNEDGTITVDNVVEGPKVIFIR